MLALAAIVAAAPAGPEPHQHVLAAPGTRAPDRVALLAGATPDLYTVAERQSDDAERWRECRLAGHEGRHRRRQ